MQKDISFSVWGARGSFPAAAEGYLGYGGNTACFSALIGSQLLIFDAGSGLAVLGRKLAEGAIRPEKIHIMISHTHIDHVMGLYMFLSQVRERFEIHLYGQENLAEALEKMTGPVFWPYSVSDSGAVIHAVSPGTGIYIDSGESRIDMRTMEGTHPGGCIWYRAEWGGKSIVYMLDCEVETGRLASMAGFAAGADLLVWDANDIPGREVKGWGHSSWVQGEALGREAGVKKVMMAHHGWAHDDGTVGQMEKEALKQRGKEPGAGPSLIFAREGMAIRI